MKKNLLLTLSVLLLAATGFTACDKEPVVQEAPAVTKVELNKNTLALATGDSETLVATVYPTNATDKVTWTSSAPSIAEVDNSGKVMALAEGDATITATAGKFSATCSVKVAAEIVPVAAVNLNKKTLEMTVGDQETLSAEVLPENATAKTVVWTSEDPDVAEVDASGKVTALSDGTTKITAEAGGIKAECAVTVADEIIPVDEVKLNTNVLELKVGAEETLSAEILPEEATAKTVVWTSGDKTIAIVDNGKVTAIMFGTTKIIAEAGGKQAECIVTVVPDKVSVTEVKLDMPLLNLEPGGQRTLVATVLPETASDKSVQWTSTNLAVATVDAAGNVTAMAVGQTTIKVTTTDGGKEASCTVNVVAAGNETWARSNIVWIPDSSMPDGGYLTFAVTRDDNINKIPANVQGLIFKWGSLVAMNMSNVKGETIKPTWKPGFFPEGNQVYDPVRDSYGNLIPAAYLDISYVADMTGVFSNDDKAEDDLKTINNGKGFDEARATGDICRLISAKGWVAGNWRLPTAQEVMDMYAVTPIDTPLSSKPGLFYGDFVTVVATPAGSSAFGDYGHGFYPITSGRMYGSNATKTDDISNPTPGMIFLPGSGSRMTDGSTKAVGATVSMWTSTSTYVGGGGAAYYYYTGNINAGAGASMSRQTGVPVRCVRE